MSYNNDSKGFKTNIGALLAAVGSAVGIGNIWRFPYKMGTEGGSLFLIVYVSVILLVCLPLLISEFVIGRAGKDSNIKAFKNLRPKTSWWVIGFLGTLTAILILCFYNLVGGWVLYYVFSSVAKDMSSSVDFAAYFGEFVSDAYTPIIFLGIFTFLTAVTILRGVQKGIEKANIFLLPLFGLFLVVLTAYTFTLPNTAQAMRYIFVPNFSLLTKTTFISALAQAFFSVSLGMGVMILYGSYIPKSANLVQNALRTTLISAVLFAIISSVFVFNIIFAYGLDFSAGPKLLFMVLPKAFAEMPFGNIISPVFFVLVFVAAFTSAISLFEVATAFLISHAKIARTQAVLLVSILVMVVGSLSSLSISGHLGGYSVSRLSLAVFSVIMIIVLGLLYKPMVKYFTDNYSGNHNKAKKDTIFTMFLLTAIGYFLYKFNATKGVFDILDTTTEQLGMPITAFFTAVFVGIAMEKATLTKELSISADRLPYKAYIFFNKYVIPAVILVIMFHTFY